MNRLLLLLSLILVPLSLSLSFYPIIPLEIVEPRLAKEILAIGFITLICATTMRYTMNLTIQNPYLPWLLLYVILHPMIAPQLDFGNDVDNMVADMWHYQPIMWAMLCTALFTVVSNLPLTKEFFREITKALAVIGGLSAFYVIFQSIGWDQFLYVNDWGDNLNTSGGPMTATLTHPNYAAVYMALTLPMMIRRRYWLLSLPTIYAIWVCQSDTAIVAGGIGLLAYGFLKLKRLWKILASSFAVAGLSLAYLTYPLSEIIVADNGRFGVWKRMWVMMQENGLYLTGHGIGSYKYYFASTEHSRFLSAHNEPYQFFFESGAIGLCLLIFMIFWLLKRLYRITINDENSICVMVSLIVFCLASLLTFVTQIEPHRYVGVVLFAIAHNLVKEGTT